MEINVASLTGYLRSMNIHPLETLIIKSTLTFYLDITKQTKRIRGRQLARLCFLIIYICMYTYSPLYARLILNYKQIITKFCIFNYLGMCIVKLNMRYDQSDQIPIVQRTHKQSQWCQRICFSHATIIINSSPKVRGSFEDALIVRLHQSIHHQNSRVLSHTLFSCHQINRFPTKTQWCFHIHFSRATIKINSSMKIRGAVTNSQCVRP